MKRTHKAILATALAMVFAAQICAPAAFAAATGSSTVTGKLTDTYSTWAGSPANAESLVKGLRAGTDITLGKTTIANTNKPMGYGNVRIALNLARAQLAAAGITNPTPEQIDASLTGGEVTNAAGAATRMQSVLQMRAEGMGWGKIANTLGFRLGGVMSGKVPASSASTGTAAGGASSAGASASTRAHGQARAYGQGIVTATGSPAGRANVMQPGSALKAGSAGNASGSGASHGQGTALGRSGR